MAAKHVNFESLYGNKSPETDSIIQWLSSAVLYDTVFCKCNWLVNRLIAQNIINILL